MKFNWKKINSISGSEYHLIQNKRHFVVKESRHGKDWFCLDWSSNLHRRFGPLCEIVEECKSHIEGLIEANSYELREHRPQISEEELERLVLLIEGCSEVTQACSRIIRHGYDGYNLDGKHLTSNRQALTHDIQDLFGCVLLMHQCFDIKLPDVRNTKHRFNGNKLKGLHHNSQHALVIDHEKDLGTF